MWRGAVVSGWGLALGLMTVQPLAATDLVISNNTTQNGGTLAIPNGVLVVTHATNNPTLTLSNNAKTSGVRAVVIGNLNGQEGNLLIQSGSDVINLYSGGSLGTYGGETVYAGEGYLGLNSGSTGTATVTGTGSTWTNSSNLYVGYFGNGTQAVENGGTVSNSSGYIGYLSGSMGAATVTGAGSTWTNSGNLHVGDSGTGTLAVENGGTVSNSSGLIGYNSGLTGTATVTGAGSTWTNSSNLYVGLSGTGTLAVENGGTVSNRYGSIGNSSGSTGAATVTGVGSTWTNTYDLYVGNFGTGTLVVENGGTVSNSNGYIGYLSGSMGAATVTGAGSTWNNSGSLSVGGNSGGAGGSGSLSVADGGHVDVGGTLKIWNTGTVTLNGGSITTGSFDKSVGTFNFQDGTLTIDGGTYTQPSGILSISGNTPTANPTLVFDNGATEVGVAAVAVGGLSGQSGTLVIAGGSSVTNVGSGSLGTIGSVTVYGGVGYLGLNSGSTGTATVTGAGSTWTNTYDLYVGYSGNGTLVVENGGTVSNSFGFIGYYSGSTGTATVTGDGSTWNNSGSLYVGSEGGAGTLTIADGGLVTANAATVWSTGEVHIGTDGTLSVTNTITNRGLIEVATGGTITAASINNRGTLINDGTINAAVTVTNGGTVGGTGTFSSLTIGDGGFADPGASPGTMNSTLTAWNGGGTYLWEINSVSGTEGMDPGWDLWNTGTLTIGATDLNPFTISLSTLDSGNNAGFLNTWNASNNYSWLIATSTNGAFGSLTGLVLDFSGFLNSLSGGYFSLASGNGGNNLYVNFNTASGPSPVPEPSSLVLLGCAAGGLFAGYRRRTRKSFRDKSSPRASLGA